MIPYLNQIVTGDARELAKAIPDESVDLIFTDPPYPDEFMWCWEWLSTVGQRVLKPGGLLMTYTGKHNFPTVISHLRKKLEWFWLFSAIMLNSDTRHHSRKVFSNHRPIPAFYKPNGSEPACLEWVGDGKKSIRDKRFHEWGQGANVFAWYISKLTTMDAVILDPFTGGGTVPAVCKMLGRNYIAFEIEPATAEAARERVLNTQPPLFVLEPEQVEMQLA
ncbi:MAG: hypothetical protein KAJ73_01010 [Zetaproteobacteria bacterium]|nr:hypothetical protein [Zetaproteobacteria bacterium]